LVVLIQKDVYTFESQYALAQFLEWSPSSLHRSLERADKCGLWSSSQKRVNHHALKELLRYGLRYVFPPEYTAPCRGVITATLPSISQPALPYVWPLEEGPDFGVGINPLDAKFPNIVQKKPSLASILYCVEVFRIGRKREVRMAEKLFDAIRKSSKVQKQ
jgi:hypothetical protein